MKPKKILIILICLFITSCDLSLSSSDNSFLSSDLVNSSSSEVIIDSENKEIPLMTFARFPVQITQTNVYLIYTDDSYQYTDMFLDVAEEYFYNHSYYDFRRLNITKNTDGTYVDETVTEEMLANHLTVINDLRSSELTSIPANTIILYNYETPIRINKEELVSDNKSESSESFKEFVDGKGEYGFEIDPIMEESFTYINIDQIKEKNDNKDSYLLIATSELCSHCKQCKTNVIDSYIQNYGVTIYNTDVSTEKLSQLNVLNIMIKATPSFIIFVDGVMVNLTIGCYSEEDLNTLFGL